MTDVECVEFLQWALPRLRLRWRGYRKVRRQVCKRIARRLRALGMTETEAYRRYLEETPGEWAVLDACCWISISCFYRDRGVSDALGRVVLPELARGASERGETRLRVWSAGCAAGEEVYTLRMAWEFAVPGGPAALDLDLLGTDTDDAQLERARRAAYPASSLRELPAAWRARAFEATPQGERLRDSFRSGVRFVRQDLRREAPRGPFDLILCRNLVFTYFEADEQARVGKSLLDRLAPGGALVIGAHETLPEGLELLPWRSCPCCYRAPHLPNRPRNSVMSMKVPPPRRG